MSLGLGDLPGWITALVALGGVAYGGWNLRALRHMRMRRQAEQIYFGYEFTVESDLTKIHVMNLSQAPITSIQIYARSFPEMTWQESQNKSLLFMQEGWKLSLYPPDPTSLIVTCVSFTDAANRTWYKLNNGKLFAFDIPVGIVARFRYFLPTWLIRIRTWKFSEVEKTAWLKKHGFYGGLFRWGFERDFGDL